MTEAARDEAIERALAGESLTSIARSNGVSRQAICGLLRRVVHTLRHDAFAELTPDTCYWIGFLFADGSISRMIPSYACASGKCGRAASHDCCGLAR